MMKLSKHPKGTIIEVAGHYGKFMYDGNYWVRTDNRFVSLSRKRVNKLQKLEQVTILAVPWSVVVELMQMVMDNLGHRDDEGNLITFDSVYKDAIKRDEESKRLKDIQGVVMHNYANADVRATVNLFNRVQRPSVIYKMQKL
jgi:hypothetical protein